MNEDKLPDKKMEENDNYKVTLQTCLPKASNYSVKINQPHALVVKLWQNKEDILLQEKIEKQNAISEIKINLNLKKNKVLERRKSLITINTKIEGAEMFLKSGKFKEAEELLLSIAKENNFKMEMGNSIALFYLNKHFGIVDQMMTTAENCIKALTFSKETYDIHYEIARLYEQYGDPSESKKIYKKFIDNFEHAFKDVSERYRNL